MRYERWGREGGRGGLETYKSGEEGRCEGREEIATNTRRRKYEVCEVGSV